MSDEQQNATEDIAPYYLAPVPYQLFDGLLDQFFRDSLPNGVKATRKNRSSGSCEYVVTAHGRPVGAIFLRYSRKGNTLIKLIPASQEKRRVRMQILLVALGTAWFIHQATDDEAAGRWLDDPPTIEVEEQIHALFADLLPPESGPRRPRRGDPIDTWLDWREEERKRKHTIRLEDIAEESGFSISTVKKHSALRRPRGTK